MVHKTCTSLGDLIKLLPTGTFFLFIFLNPVLTNDGNCNTVNRYLSGILMLVSGFSCCFSWFTDSYVDSEGFTKYGIVTKKGLFVLSDSSDTKLVNSSRYKLRLGDFLHALLSVLIFAIVALLDPNTVKCFYPSFGSEQQVLLTVLPPVVGTIFSFVFVMFPNKRHGIGLPSSHVSQES
ncbi:Dmp2 [Thalictrum thalictroides]|uniref:Dmp2 n=1 Tax=Thalictrum thalictroides TaxID=46969 RepID=A0A7J6UTJ6_THATH|nr:Dmp2 [Thalictrum thalictroides]